MNSPQRTYRAACPGCGAPVEFASATSASAVCGFCRSTLVRDGEALTRIGVSAELFDDHTPLQLGVRGTHQGVAFTLVGRLQYRYEGGTWNEWHAMFDNGRSGWLSEDNGAYVFAFDGPRPDDAPADAAALARLQAGQRVLADGRAWDVASRVEASLLAAEGELPAPPRLQGSFTVVDLRNGAGEVATLDGSDPAQVHWSVGRAVALSELALSGLKDSHEKTLGGRGIECPNCGAGLTVTLATTQAIVCTQCASVVDVSAGVGAELKAYRQNNAGQAGAEPLIPLGRSGTIALGPEGALPWQVVGYQERCDIPETSEDEVSFWREYLLWHATQGFAFLVDSNEGWSTVRPLTGAPQVRGDSATWEGSTYRKKWAYGAKVTWVLGEFYWRVRQGERAHVTDYENGPKKLSREQTGNEVTWSAGTALDASAVAQAFGLKDAVARFQRDDVKPFAASSVGWNTLITVLVVLFLLAMLLSTCSGDRCDEVRRTFGAASPEYQQCQRNAGSGDSGRGGSGSGGSYGGWSGGGGHK